MGNAAVYEAIHLAKFASKVYLYIAGCLQATVAVGKLQSTRIVPVLSSIVTKINGETRVSSIEIKNVKDGSVST